jgi:transaldolase
MMREGEFLGRIAPNVVIKLPLTEAGLRACKHMVNNGVMVNVTLCFSAAQALLAGKAGATYISPFVGRLDDIGQDGMQLIEDTVQIYDNYPAIKTEVLVASIRHPIHLIQAAKIGAHVATLPPSVIKSLYKHPLTDRGLESFLADWKKTGQSIL